MRSINIITIIFTVLLSVTTTNAQLKNLLKKKKNKDVKSTSSFVLDWSMYNQTPAITFHSLLYGTAVSISGHTTFDSYTSTFVPGSKADGSRVNTVHDQSEYLKIKVYKEEEFITYFEYDGNQTAENGKKRKYNQPSTRYKRDGEWASGTNIDLKKWGDGMYRLDFYAGNKMFYSFDFEVYKLTNDDSYAKVNEMYLTRGPWNKYAYLNHADTGNLIFGFYLNHEEFNPNPSNNKKTNKKLKWSVKMNKDNKPFAKEYSSGKGGKLANVKRGVWNDFSTAMRTIDKKETVKFSNLADGSYVIEVQVEGEALARIYSFNVKNKKIVLIPEQDRNKNTDKTRLIEGWNDYVWLKLKKK